MTQVEEAAERKSLLDALLNMAVFHCDLFSVRNRFFVCLFFFCFVFLFCFFVCFFWHVTCAMLDTIRCVRL